MKPITLDFATNLFKINNSYDDLKPYYHNLDENDNTEEEFVKDVLTVEDLDDWTIDDLLQALPKSLEYDNKLYDFRLKFVSDYNSWEVCYENQNTGDSCYSTFNIDRYNALIDLYIKLNNNNLL